jgi:hypothetical protein
VLQSVPGAMEHAKMPGWIKKHIAGKREQGN